MAEYSGLEHGELYILVREDGSVVQKLFWSIGEVESHLDGLGKGKGTMDNDKLRGGLEVKRYVIADMEAA